MITEAIIILVSVLVGWILRGYRIGQVREMKIQLKKKFLKDKSGVVDWTAPLSAEELAEEEVRKKLKKNV